MCENDSDLQVGTSSIFGHPSESSSATQSSGAIVGDNLGVQQPNVWGLAVLSSVSCGVTELVLELVVVLKMFVVLVVLILFYFLYSVVLMTHCILSDCVWCNNAVPKAGSALG